MYSVLDMTLKGIRGEQVDNRKVVRAKYFELFFNRSINYISDYMEKFNIALSIMLACFGNFALIFFAKVHRALN